MCNCCVRRCIVRLTHCFYLSLTQVSSSCVYLLLLYCVDLELISSSSIWKRPGNNHHPELIDSSGWFDFYSISVQGVWVPHTPWSVWVKQWDTYIYYKNCYWPKSYLSYHIYGITLVTNYRGKLVQNVSEFLPVFTFTFACLVNFVELINPNTMDGNNYEFLR